MSLLNVFLMLGGVGMFLYGMNLMSVGLTNVAGDNLRVVLERTTKNKYTGVLVGTGVTGIIQSSSATIVMLIGFVSAGLMSLTQAVGVLMGANIGTTVTAQITAFKLSTYAPLILFVGAIMRLFFSRNTIKHLGTIILGFGLLFFGISTMGTAITPLKESQSFIDLLSGLDNPLLMILFGLVFTCIIQSSSSSTVLIQQFAVNGLVTYHMAAYFVMGAAIGSATPDVLASLTSNRDGKRTALIDVIFNVFRCMFLSLLIAVFPQFLEWIVSLSPNDIARQIANTHMIFSMVAVVVELPFTNQLVALSKKLIPVTDAEKKKVEKKLVYLNQANKIPPAIAATQAKREVCRMGKIARDNLVLSLDAFFEKDGREITRVFDTEDTINFLNHSITGCLASLRSKELTPRDLNRIGMMFLVVADIERIGDHAENIAEFAELHRSGKAKLSDTAIEELKRLSQAAIDSIDLSLAIYEKEEYSELQHASDLEEAVDQLQETLIENHVERLLQNRCDPMGGVVFTDMVTDLERCSDHAINIAYAITEKRSCATA